MCVSLSVDPQLRNTLLLAKQSTSPSLTIIVLSPKPHMRIILWSELQPMRARVTATVAPANESPGHCYQAGTTKRQTPAPVNTLLGS